MKPIELRFAPMNWQRIVFRLFLSSIVFSLGIAGCNLQQLNLSQSARLTEVRATELQLHVEQTLVALQSTQQVPELTLQAQRATLQAQQAQGTRGVLNTATPQAPNAEFTQATEQTLQTQAVATTPMPSETPAVLDPQALQERMKSANILLYEDMVAHIDTKRYAKETLLRMGLPFKDDGNAKGWLAKDLENNAPNGEAWDLVILAVEDKVGAQGEFFNYALQALDKGASVILEVWFLDQTHGGSAGQLLDRCGLAYHGDREKIPPAQMALYVLDAGDPILNQPNPKLSFTANSNYWWDPNGRQSYDTGDLLKLAPGGSARLLVGTQAKETTSHGVLAVCEDGRLILQTFSSHTLTFDAGTLIWENYIYNALRKRFEP